MLSTNCVRNFSEHPPIPFDKFFKLQKETFFIDKETPSRYVPLVRSPLPLAMHTRKKIAPERRFRTTAAAAGGFVAVHERERALHQSVIKACSLQPRPASNFLPARRTKAHLTAAAGRVQVVAKNLFCGVCE